MQTRRFRTALAGAVMSLVACAPAGERHVALIAKDAAEVTLRYGWRPGTRARVSVLRQEEAPGKSSDLSMNYTIEAVARDGGGEGLELIYSDVVIAGDVDPLVRALTERFPAIRVAGSGQFAEVSDPRGFVRAWRLQLQQTFSSEVMDGLDGLLSPQAVVRSAQEEWQARVGMWVARRVTRVPVRERATAPMPGVAGMVLELDVEYMLVGMVPCQPEASEARCAHVRLTSRPNSQSAGAAEALVAEQMTQAMGSKARLAVSDLKSDTTIDVITEPATLRLHRFERVSETGMTLSIGGQVQEVNRRVTTSELYRYEDNR